MSYLTYKKTFDKLSLDELYQILDLRLRVFVEEQKILYTDTDFHDQECIHYMIKDQNKIVCYLRLFPPGTKYQEHAFGRLATDRAYRKQGLATQLVKEVLHDIEGQPLRISAQAYLKAYYEKLGFVVVKDRYLEENIPHYEMLAQNKAII